jgi:hypothetical protein
VLPSRVCLLRGALRLPCGVVPRVRDALPPYDDALLPALTYVSLHVTVMDRPSKLSFFCKPTVDFIEAYICSIVYIRGQNHFLTARGSFEAEFNKIHTVGRESGHRHYRPRDHSPLLV